MQKDPPPSLKDFNISPITMKYALKETLPPEDLSDSENSIMLVCKQVSPTEDKKFKKLLSLILSELPKTNILISQTYTLPRFEKFFLPLLSSWIFQGSLLSDDIQDPTSSFVIKCYIKKLHSEGFMLKNKLREYKGFEYFRHFNHEDEEETEEDEEGEFWTIKAFRNEREKREYEEKGQSQEIMHESGIRIRTTNEKFKELAKEESSLKFLEFLGLQGKIFSILTIQCPL